MCRSSSHDHTSWRSLGGVGSVESQGKQCRGCGHQQAGPDAKSRGPWRIQKSREGCDVIVTDGACSDFQVRVWNDQEDTWGAGEKGAGPTNLVGTRAGSGILCALQPP